MPLLRTLPHRAHIELRVPRGNLEQARRLRPFLNIAQLDASAGAIHFHHAVEFRVNPHITLLAFGGNAFVLYRAPSVQTVAAYLRAAAPLLVSSRLFGGLLPLRTGIVHIVHTPELSDQGLDHHEWRVHVHVPLRHKNDVLLLRFIEDYCAWSHGCIPALHFVPDLSFTRINLLQPRVVWFRVHHVRRELLRHRQRADHKAPGQTDKTNDASNHGSLLIDSLA